MSVCATAGTVTIVPILASKALSAYAVAGAQLTVILQRDLTTASGPDG